jgi:hypothetical protein
VVLEILFAAFFLLGLLGGFSPSSSPNRQN